MKKNRKVPKKINAVTQVTTHFGTILAFLFVMVILNFFALSSCQRLQTSVGEKSRTLERLDKSLVRERTLWEQMKVPEKIDSALVRHGLKMRVPRTDQYVQMRENGQPYVGQRSVVLAQRRNGAVSTAQVRKR